MKTTLDLPDALVKQVKLRAVREGRKLKDAVADLLRKGLAVAAHTEAGGPGAGDHEGQGNGLASDRVQASRSPLRRK